MANVFGKGHRVRVDVTSSSFPRFSRNLNTGEDVGTGTRIDVAHLREDGLGGLWLWAVAGDAEGAAAEQALRMAAGLTEL